MTISFIAVHINLSTEYSFYYAFYYTFTIQYIYIYILYIHTNIREFYCEFRANYRVPGESPEALRKLCFSTDFSHQKTR